jgi:hypothetical protein
MASLWGPRRRPRLTTIIRQRVTTPASTAPVVFVYVMCSLAEESLTIVYYSDNPGLARTALLQRGGFADDEIEVVAA